MTALWIPQYDKHSIGNYYFCERQMLLPHPTVHSITSNLLAIKILLLYHNNTHNLINFICLQKSAFLCIKHASPYCPSGYNTSDFFVRFDRNIRSLTLFKIGAREIA
jgi:hypothetical protein